MLGDPPDLFWNSSAVPPGLGRYFFFPRTTVRAIAFRRFATREYCSLCSVFLLLSLYFVDYQLLIVESLDSLSPND